MTRANLVLWAIFIVILVDHTSKGQYEADDLKLHDKTTANDKMLIVKLASELLKDAKLKQRQIMYIRKKQRIFLDYEMGLLMGKIREKYKRMMEIYTEATNIYTNKTDFTAPGRNYNKPLHHIIYMEQIHTLEVEIDMIIRIIESIPADTFKTVEISIHRSTTAIPETTISTSMTNTSVTPTSVTPTSVTPTSVTPTSNTTPSKRRLRLRAEGDPSSDTEAATSTPADLLSEPEFENEDDIKQYNREKYERKKGHNTNWTLDAYYGF